jgi:pyridoxine/pyridoxamine 5'-phosphate oxidase
VPIELTDEMVEAVNRALEDRMPCIVATASADGMPDLSYRGSVLALDREHLAFWERVKGETLRNLESNPQAAIFYRNSQTRQNWRFYGSVTVLRDGPKRDEILARVHPFELAQDPERTGIAVLIRIDRIRTGSETIMTRGA